MVTGVASLPSLSPRRGLDSFWNIPYPSWPLLALGERPRVGKQLKQRPVPDLDETSW